MAGCCSDNCNFAGMSAAYKRALLWVIGINGLMFLIEMSAGIGAQSQALQADALDFLGDTFINGQTQRSKARRAGFASLLGGECSQDIRPYGAGHRCRSIKRWCRRFLPLTHEVHHGPRAIHFVSYG